MDDAYLRMMSRALVVLVIPGGIASNTIYDGDDNEHAAVENGEVPPSFPYIYQHSGFAGLAVVAQLRLLVAPRSAVTVRHRRPRPRHFPHRRVLVHQPTVRRWLTTTRLYIYTHTEKKKNN